MSPKTESQPAAAAAAAERDSFVSRIALLEAEIRDVRAWAQRETARANALALVVARQEANLAFRRLAAEPEARCARSSVCIDTADLLMLLVALPPAPAPRREDEG